MYVKVIATNIVAEVRMQLKDHYVIRYQDGVIAKVAHKDVRLLELANGVEV